MMKIITRRMLLFEILASLKLEIMLMMTMILTWLWQSSSCHNNISACRGKDDDDFEHLDFRINSKIPAVKSSQPS